ncbi:helix-turn-helix domain-containing protein [Mycobacterium avium]|uniref:helix-turn-helix domain-containing protein n=1 Tax=Mycobacterium avium TaxID=1764 RepID=UPI003F767286
MPAQDRYPGDWRVLAGLTQPQLAAAAGIGTTTLREIESAITALTDANATTLAGLLGIKVYDDGVLLRGVDRFPAAGWSWAR